MRRVHCRKCWQQTLQMTRQCAFCGDTDIVRRAKGLGELLIYIAGGTSIIGLMAWIAVTLF